MGCGDPAGCSVRREDILTARALWKNKYCYLVVPCIDRGLHVQGRRGGAVVGVYHVFGGSRRRLWVSGKLRAAVVFASNWHAVTPHSLPRGSRIGSDGLCVAGGEKSTAECAVSKRCQRAGQQTIEVRVFHRTRCDPLCGGLLFVQLGFCLFFSCYPVAPCSFLEGDYDVSATTR